MRKGIYLAVFVLVNTSMLPGQQLPPVTNGWLLFEKVKFTPQFYKEFNDYYLTPFLDSKIRQYENQEIILKGHYMPFDPPEKNVVILSRYPYAQCFFCGGAGPESVAEIVFKEKPPRFKKDQMLEISGKLKLNNTDIKHMNFILKDAVLITP